ncbi:MAG TPA: hypothetical protein VE967_15085 [Gemmatimonadaceae bacterium]|nr:hypothetical protein [Gemmatimonadaceae bacterium]
MAVAVMGACHGAAAPPPAGIPAAPAPVAPRAPDAPPPPRFAAPTAPASYVLEGRSIVSARADTLARVDTLDTRAALQVTPRGAAVDVAVSAYSIQPSGGTALTLTTPARAVGRFTSSGGVEFEGAGRTSCTAISQSAIEATRDLWIKWPADVRTGIRWRDSSAVSICRDGVPLQLTLVREYRITGITGDSVAIARSSSMRISGRGPIRGDTTTVSGDGTGTATLRASMSSGWVLDGQGSSTMHLTARGAQRTQTVEQRSVISFRQSADSPRR